MTEGLPIGTYNIIYADPPWRYEQRKVQGAAENHYPTMSIDELCALPVLELAAKDCALFLWATFPQLPEALRLIRAWGFRYKTVAFVWLKRNRKSPSWFYGMGYWTRSNAEICLLATKGKPKRQSAGVHQFILLSYFLDMSDAEIANVLNMVRRSVAYRRTSTLKLLKNLMGGENR